MLDVEVEVYKYLRLELTIYYMQAGLLRVALAGCCRDFADGGLMVTSLSFTTLLGFLWNTSSFNSAA